MRVIQVVPTLLYGDGVGNAVLALDAALKNKGYKTAIYAENISPKVERHIAKPIEKIGDPNNEDILIYHFGCAFTWTKHLRDFKCKIIFAYHNITPPEFFKDYDIKVYADCKRGRQEISRLADIPDYCVTFSNFNKQDLLENGYKCKIDIVPALIQFSDYGKKCDAKFLEKLKADTAKKIIFTGRVCPHKKFEDVIASFYDYQKFFNKNSKLYLVGKYDEYGKYYFKLKEFVETLKLKNVFFTGHISFSQILSYYKAADLFLCQSEHEGFCVPLVEAMLFDVPIVAYDSSAVGETLGDGGILLQEKDPLLTASVMAQILEDELLRKKISENQKRRLENFSSEKACGQFLNCIETFIKTQGNL